MGNTQEKPTIRYSSTATTFKLNLEDAQNLCSKIEGFAQEITNKMQPVLDQSILNLLKKQNVTNEDLVLEFKEQYNAARDSFSGLKMGNLSRNYVEILESEMQNNKSDKEFYQILNEAIKFSTHFQQIKNMREQFEEFLLKDKVLDQIYDRFIKLHSQNVSKETYPEDFKQVINIMINRFIKIKVQGNFKFSTLLWHFILTPQNRILLYISLLAQKLEILEEFLQEGITFVKDYTQQRMANYNKSSLINSNSKNKLKANSNYWDPVRTSCVYMQSQINSSNKLSFLDLNNANLSTIMGQGNISMINPKKMKKSTLKNHNDDELTQSKNINLSPLEKLKKSDNQLLEPQKQIKEKVTFSRQFDQAEQEKEKDDLAQTQFQKRTKDKAMTIQDPQLGKGNAKPKVQVPQQSFSVFFSEAAKDKDTTFSPAMKFSQNPNTQVPSAFKLEETASPSPQQQKKQFSLNNSTDQKQNMQDPPILNHISKDSKKQLNSINQNIPVPESFSKIFSQNNASEVAFVQNKIEEIKEESSPIESDKRQKNNNSFSYIFGSVNQNRDEEMIKSHKKGFENSPLQIMGFPLTSKHEGVATTTDVLANLCLDRNSSNGSNHSLTLEMRTSTKLNGSAERLQNGSDLQQFKSMSIADDDYQEKSPFQSRFENNKNHHLFQNNKGITEEQIELNLEHKK